MKEHSSRKVNVLGIDVAVMRPERAVGFSMDYMRSRGLEVVFFHSAESSLFCQNQDWAADFVQNCQLVLAGDSHMELAVRHRRNDSVDRKGIGDFADEYLKRLFTRLNRESREIFAVMETEEELDSLRRYIENSYPDIFCSGIVYHEKDGEDPGKVINEINANIPDIVFFCLPVEQQLMFVREYLDMMNTRLCICIESVRPLIRKETERVPRLIRLLRLEEFWYRMKKDSIIKKTVVGSIFKSRVMQEDNAADGPSGDEINGNRNSENEGQGGSDSRL